MDDDIQVKLMQLLGETMLFMPNKIWLYLIAVILIGIIVSALVSSYIDNLIKRLLMRHQILPGDMSTKHLFTKPIHLILVGWVWSIGLALLQFPKSVIGIMTVGSKSLTYFGIGWTLWKSIDIFHALLHKRAQQTETKFDDLLAPLISRSLKVLVVLLGAASISEILNFPISSLIAGLGIGGLAVAMAAKDTIANVFGSLTVIGDRPFHIGDWVIINNVEGSVESLGFRSTRIRTFYDSLITVPNSVMLTAIVDNMGQRQYRRVKTNLGITYDTSRKKIDEFCEGIREIIRKHDSTRKDYFLVYLNGFGESSLDIMLYFFVDVPDWNAELAAKHDIFSKIIGLASDLGVGFAFPTRSLYLENGPNTN